MKNAPPSLVTNRLALRLPQTADAAAIADYYTRNRAHLEATDPVRPGEYYTVEFWAARAGVCLDEFGRDHSVRLILLPRDAPGHVIGAVNLTAIQRGVFQAANLGYSIDAAMQGRGLMHEALTVTIAYAFGPLNLHRIFASYLPANDRSARVLERLGFERIGYCRDYLQISGRWQDHVLTSLMNPSWRPQ
jgi:ribosomal-protein-alanine N-acetyltransferase